MVGKNSQVLSIGIVVFLLIFSCKKKEASPPLPPPEKGKNSVFVVCEGSYGNGNSTLGMYNVETDSFYEDVFSAVNGQQLGDVFQSMTLIGNHYFLCINNSDKIIVINKENYEFVTGISIPKPRHILPISSSKAYVSSLFGNEVHILDLNSLKRTGSITLPAENPEGMLLWNDRVIVCAWDTAADKIFYLNTATDAIEKEITVSGRAPHSCVMDRENKLWVLSGNVYKDKPSFLTRLDPATGAILKSFSFPATSDVIKPVLNAAKDSLYFIAVNYDGGAANNGIYRMNIAATELPQQPFLPAQAFQYFWALDIHPNTGNLFIGDPKGFVQKGEVLIYEPDGTLLKSFKTGVGPGHFYFD